ncbi:MAG: MFS transporter, partial [Myxococcota bacterium]|nr:MFS transporter [Myxococcota bacterium]
MQQQRVPVVAYGLPAFGVMGATVLFTAYIVKYSTDVLLVPAGVMGVLFAVGRLWDGVTDPLVGFLSDRTETRWGRRRPWMVASVLPLALFGWMAWAPPLTLEGGWLVAWMAVAVLGFSTATTLFFVPHNALGAELVEDYTRRTSVFAAREYFTVSASLLSLGG